MQGIDGKPQSAPPDRKIPEGENWLESRKMFYLFLILFGFVLSAHVVQAQDVDSFAPNILHHPNKADDGNDLDSPHDSNELNRHFSSTGKPCIALDSYVTPQVINKKIYEHWIKASNSCGQNIKIQVCYHKTDDCIVMNVPAFDNKNAVLGIQPSMKEFEYDAKVK